jgi:MoaA/NifB/PqqE/SkfB family radical SAM enzyme
MLFERLFKRKQRTTNKPRFCLQLDITNNCNLRCSHCYQRGSAPATKELGLDDWKQIVRQFHELTAQLDTDRTILISGGEPLTSDIWHSLISHIKSADTNTRVMLLTNGTLINDDTARFLKETDVSAQISFDGPNAQMHDHFRGKGTFKRAMDGALALFVNGVPFTLQAVLQKQIVNLIPDFFKLAKTIHAGAMDFTRLIRTCDAPAQDEQMLVGQELKRAFEIIHSSSHSAGIPTATVQPLWCLIDPNLGHPSSAGFLGLTINPSGKIQLTSRVLESIGDATEKNGISRAYFDNKLLRSLRAGKIRGCGTCEYFKKCRGDRNISYITSGDFLGPDEHCWYWRDCLSSNIS